MKKTMIAMSGGVDSSVAALLTKQAGDECIGVTMKLYHNEEVGIEGQKTCCSLDDVEDARAVCRRLGMRFYVFNFTDCFKETVIDRFVDAYRHGRTPNPCIDCNCYLKFGKLIQRMRELQMDYVATGHYARVEYDRLSGRYLLKKGIDELKDQSYVLYMLTQEQLAHIRFPLGALTKDEVRRIAGENGFVNAGKRDSQDICFVSDGDYVKVIEAVTGEVSRPGEFVDRTGKVLGRHEGIIHYTIGQRRGLRLAAGERMYVTDISPEDNRVVLGKNEDLFQSELTADQVNLIACDRLEKPVRVTAKIRYRHREQPATAWQTAEGRLHVRFDEPQRAVTKGQAVVLYDGDSVVGGGMICGTGL
ncbi:MAG: tRNA 2-thiouridine(34) synthase MnmA [Lachnospiraceae bacterium]|nr:tRNA 2-thiouridine(34) synthase MnmA [Lachnospiraceae bacterium]